MLDDKSNKSYFFCFQFFFKLLCLILIFCICCHWTNQKLIDDESDGDGSESGYHGTYSFRAFSFHFRDYVGNVSGLESGICARTGVESKYDIFAFEVFIPIGLKSKVGQIIEMFWR